MRVMAAILLHPGSALRHGRATIQVSPAEATVGRNGTLRRRTRCGASPCGGPETTASPHPGTALDGRRVTRPRLAALTAALVVVSAAVFLLDRLELWPLFIFPLILAAVFFFELGSLVVATWVGAVFVGYLSLHGRADPDTTRQVIIGLAMFTIAGLVLGRVQRSQHTLREMLAATSLTDRLTSLYNYGTFVDYLHNEITKVDRYGGCLSLIMFDLDHFKRFNDLHGHETGNDLLRRVGLTLRSMVRDADMAARYGGEEFALLIRGNGSEGFELAERVRRAIETIAVDLRNDETVFATVSAGVATYPNGSNDESILIEQADEALYESKRRGRNCVTLHADADLGDELSVTLSA
jgi:diguanylate cyclase (GGDEF)-like protein